MPDLLIHSLSEFREIIEGVLSIVAPTHVVEVGAESGRTTEFLSDWAMARGARLTTIDPAPADRVRAVAARSAATHRLLIDRSPGALEGLDAAQLYLLDGDHNYWTVNNELKHVHEAATKSAVMPVVLAHDVGWPCARRDQYCAPDKLPPESVHPHTFTKGLHIDAAELIDGGFTSEGFFAIALEEGGPRNGVLTAVEDFMAESPGYELHVVPGVFGLGVLFPTAHPRREELVDLLRGYERNPLLARLEENRLRNWLEVLALIRREKVIVGERDAARAERDANALDRDARARERDALAEHRDALARERDALARDRDQLEERIVGLEAELRAAEQRTAQLKARWYAKAGLWIDDRVKRPAS